MWFELQSSELHLIKTNNFGNNFQPPIYGSNKFAYSINFPSICAVEKSLEKKSRFLSLILRHDPSKAGITLTSEGWANTNEIVKALQISIEQLKQIVAENDKKRFELSPDNRKIRASQGHSIKVDIDWEDVTDKIPGGLLLHGTKAEYLESIFEKGLLKMKRTHVHLTADMKLAVKRAQTGKGQGVVLTIQPKGAKVFKSANDVYLMEIVPPEMIWKPPLYV